MQARALSAALGLTGMALIANPAASMTYNPHSLAAADIARVTEVCERVLRVRPGDLHFYSCIDSLSHSLRSDGRSAGGAPMSAEAPGGAASYYAASSKVAIRREQIACAAVGFEESAPGFTACVADLGESLRAADDPPIT